MKTLPILLAVLGLCACSQGETDAGPAAGAGAEPAPSVSATPVVAEPCRTLSAEAAQALQGLTRMGKVGTVEFFGEADKVLCSEPGPGERGECELTGPTSIRVVTGDQVSGLQYEPAEPGILRYGPDGLSCHAR